MYILFIPLQILISSTLGLYFSLVQLVLLILWKTTVSLQSHPLILPPNQPPRDQNPTNRKHQKAQTNNKRHPIRRPKRRAIYMRPGNPTELRHRIRKSNPNARSNCAIQRADALGPDDRVCGACAGCCNYQGEVLDYCVGDCY